MNDNAKKLVAALRSGKYKQCTGRLCRLNSKCEVTYCCLGVACEVAIENGVELTACYDENETMKGYDETSTALPLKVQVWLGFMLATGAFIGDSLIHLNDSGKTFAEIADVIESEPPGLFV